jgi:hypothetical protein
VTSGTRRAVVRAYLVVAVLAAPAGALIGVLLAVWLSASIPASRPDRFIEGLLVPHVILCTAAATSGAVGAAITVLLVDRLSESSAGSRVFSAGAGAFAGVLVASVLYSAITHDTLMPFLGGFVGLVVATFAFLSAALGEYVAGRSRYAAHRPARRTARQ